MELALACRALYLLDSWESLPAEPHLPHSYLPRGYAAELEGHVHPLCPLWGRHLAHIFLILLPFLPPFQELGL